MKNLVFITCLSLFFGHELDAVSQAEWRLLYGLRELQADSARELFVALHVPLLGLVLWLGWHPARRWRESSRRLLAGFAVVHAGLHFNLRLHPLYSFDSVLSQLLIFGCAAVAALYLLLTLMDRHSTHRRPLTAQGK